MKNNLLKKIKNFVYPMPEQKSASVKSYSLEELAYLYSSSNNSILTGYGYSSNEYLPPSDYNILGVATALRCIAVIADSIAQTPFNLFIKDERTVKKATKHHLFELFDYAPNEWQDPFQFMQMVGLRLAMQGEIVIWKVSALGKITQLIPFPMEKVTINDYEFDSRGFKKLVYVLEKDNGSLVKVPSEDIWHIKRMNVWKMAGLQIDRICQAAIRMAISEEDYIYNFLNNGIKPAGVLSSKQGLDEKQYEIIRNYIKKYNAGAENSGNLLILSNEFDYKSINTSNADAQFVENREVLINDICRFFGVPPYKVYQYKNNISYSSSEHDTLTFITDTLAPIFRAIEKGALFNLISREEYRKGYYFKFNEKALLRMDAKTQAEVERTKVNIGMYTLNEVRALEELPPVDGGDDPLVQGAMIKLKDVGAAYNVTGKNTETINQEENSSLEEN